MQGRNPAKLSPASSELSLIFLPGSNAVCLVALAHDELKNGDLPNCVAVGTAVIRLESWVQSGKQAAGHPGAIGRQSRSRQAESPAVGGSREGS